MKPPKASVRSARKSEEGYQAAIQDAVASCFASTTEGRAWREAQFDIAEKHCGIAPFAAAVEAWRRGRTDCMTKPSQTRGGWPRLPRQ